MKKVLLDEKKQISLAILEELNRICRLHDITYYLGYGTLIGAVRHKGFIPWDDDVDIWINWKDYNRLLETLRSEKKYQILECVENDEYPLLFAKLSDPQTIVKKKSDKAGDYARGISIDIFPLCNYPQSKIKLGYIKLLLFFGKILLNSRLKHKKKSIRGRCMIAGSLMLHTFGISVKKIIIRLFQQFDIIHESGYVFSPFSPYKNDIHRSIDFDNTIVASFEGKLFPIPIGYEQILRNIYGDYMQLPSEEQRIPNHDVEAFIL